jgi:DNA-binding response OmpR family regulator
MTMSPLMIDEDGVRVIVVEDEPELRDNLVIGLSAHGFEVRGAGNATSLAVLMEETPVDIRKVDLLPANGYG